MPGTCIPTYPAIITLRAEDECWFLGETSVPEGSKNDWIWRFSSGFGEKQEKRAQRPSRSVEGLIRRLSGRTGSNAGPFFRISSVLTLKPPTEGVPSPRKTKKSSLFACISGGLCWSSVPCVRCDGHPHRSRWWGGSRGSRGHRRPLLRPTPNAPFLARPPSYGS